MSKRSIPPVGGRFLSILLLVPVLFIGMQGTVINNESNKMNNSIENTAIQKRSHVPFVLNLSENGTEKVTAILDSTKSVQMRSGFVTLQPGENVGSHNTGEHEELLVILDGKGEIDAQGLGKKEVAGGMVVYIPPKNQHNVFCAGSGPFKYIYVVSKTK